MIKPRIAEKLT